MSSVPRSEALHRTVTLAMLAALAYAVMAVGKVMFPIQIAGFLTLDFKDALLAIAGFLYGPVAGLLVSVTVAAVECVTVSSTGLIGLVMNALSSALFVCPAAWLYNRHRTMKGALAGLVGGVLTMTAGMLLWNYLITPLYMAVDRSVVVGMLLPTILPFNLLKGAANAALALLLYKTVVRVLRAARLLPAAEETAGRTRSFVWILALIGFLTLLLAALVWANVI